MTDDPIRLQGAQRSIRDAYVDHDAGLFTLDCVPGSGKSVVAYHLAAEELLTRYIEGDPTPEQHVAVISFTRGEASNIVPALRDRLRTICAHNLVPGADHLSDRELDYLAQRVGHARFVGTIDSILRDIFTEITHEVGFEDQPAVGSTAQLQQVHAECYKMIQRDSTLNHRLNRLEAAYPDEPYRDGVDTLLKTAIEYCRNRRLTTAELRRELKRTIDCVYPGGRPESDADVFDAVRQFVGIDTAVADETARDGSSGPAVAGAAEAAADVADDESPRDIAAVDAQLHEDWLARIDDFCAVVAAYHTAYRIAIRDRGVVSHTDVAYLIDAYFSGQIADIQNVSDIGNTDAAVDSEALGATEGLGDIDDDHRNRIRDRYRTRLQSVIIDEAQDVSERQHAALSHVVSSEARVFCAGDLLQSIYRWRNADPDLFESAIRNGTYFGIDWETHEHRTATTTYRCRPALADAITAIADPILTDPTRGDSGDLDVTYPGLDADRESTPETNVHVAAFDPMDSNPDSYIWCHPVEGRGEADAIAALVSKGLGDGTFTDDDGEPLDIDVLFRWSSKMDAYEEAFTEAGIRVRNASQNLFECTAVDAVCAVCDWLIAPESIERTRRLAAESSLGLSSLGDTIATHDGDLDRVLAAGDPSAAQAQILAGLTALRDRRETVLSRPASTYVEDIIEALGLRADPHGTVCDCRDTQRVVNLDALTETIREWEGERNLIPRELTTLLQPFRDRPHLGPNYPRTATADADVDVEFRTIHSAKGDESDIVILANPGVSLTRNGVHSKRFLTQGTCAGLAPPTNVANAGAVSIPPYENGLYTPADPRDPDSGLRWMTARWRDAVDADCAEPLLIGPDRLQQVANNDRAEEWRLLYVALTRARDHLVIPLPRTLPYDARPRDRWLDAIRDRLAFSQDRTGTYTLDASSTSADPVEIGVNDVELGAQWTPDTVDRRPDVAVTPPRSERLDPWIPRFIQPSTMYPLTEDPTQYVLPHLLGDALHTAANDVPDDHPLPFDRLGPDAVGRCLHTVLTTLLDRGISESAIRRREAVIREVFLDSLSALTPNIGTEERESLYAFLDEAILDDFLASDLWTLIQDAQSVSVETPLHGLGTIGDIEVEIHGTADVIVETAAGKRHVVDLKISLAPLTAETRRRYELQVATYAYLFEQQYTSASQVQRSVETFGVDRETITSPWPPSVVERRLERLDEE